MHSNTHFNKKELNQVIDIATDYLKSDNFILNYKSPDELKEIFPFSINNQPDTDLKSLIEKYLQYSVKTSSPQFLNQLWAGFSYPSLIAEVINNVANTSMYTYEASPVAVLIEKELIETMLDYAGFEGGEGIFTTGGTAGNISALLAARNHYDPSHLKQGLRKHFHIYVSEVCHYSFDTAANVAGIGTENLIRVKTNENFEMIPEELEKEIQKSLSMGATPLFVAATSGTTVEGAFDPLRELHKVSKKHNLWFHVDGAYGGSAILSEKLKHKLDGIELADSLTWDPHKLMGIPLVCSVLLINQKGILAKAHYHGEKDKYLFHQNDSHQYNTGGYSIQCGRRPDALKLFLTWKYFGKKEMANRVEKLFSLSQFAKEKVLSFGELELLSEVYSTNICFRYKPKNNHEIEEFNVLVREKLIKDGLSMVNYARVRGKLIIRLVVTSPDILEKDITLFFDNFMKVARELDV